MRILVIILMALFFSCSPQKRLNRLVKRNPELVRTDTIVLKDTIRDTISFTTDLVHLDTIISIKEFYDTVTIIKDNLTIRYYYDTIEEKVYLEGQCDTIWIEVPYEKIVEYKVPCDTVTAVTSPKWVLWIIITAIILALLWYVKMALMRPK